LRLEITVSPRDLIPSARGSSRYGPIGRYKRRLFESGFDAVAVTSFDDALQALRTCAPDLLATEVRLGDHNGLHLALRAHDLYPELPILVIGSERDGASEAGHFGATFLRFPEAMTR
jgi:DNA-binding NtrC family response regulator